MNIVAVVSRKGGVAKTTTAHALGAGLAKRHNRVLYVDLDGQSNLSFTMNADIEEVGSMEVLTGSATASEAIQQTAQGDIIAGSARLSAADITLTDTGKEYRLREALETVKRKYDYVIIDTPAALNILTVNALTATTGGVIIPVMADAYSLQGLTQVIEEVDTVKKYCNPHLKIKGILITRYSSRAILAQTVRQDLQDAAKSLHTHLYTEPIRECVAIREAAAVQQNIFDYAPRSNAARDYDSFINEFLTKKGR